MIRASEKERTCRVEGAHAEGAVVGAAAARFVIDQPALEIDLAGGKGGGEGVEIVGRRDERTLDQLAAATQQGAGDSPLRLLLPRPGSEEGGKGFLSFATNQGADAGMFLEQLSTFPGEFRTADDDAQLWPHHRQGIDELQGRRAIPDVDGEGDDIGLRRQEGGEDLLLRLVDGELADPHFAAVAAAGRRQAGEGEAGVDVFAVQGGENGQHGREDKR